MAKTELASTPNKTKASAAPVSTKEQLEKAFESLRSAIPNLKIREGQMQMASLVQKSLAEKSMCLIEAGTGTGKTMGYLIPFLSQPRLIEDSQRAIVVTANNTLLHQIYNKDLPTLKQCLNVPFRYSIAKGITNYVCKLQVENYKSDGINAFDYDLDQKNAVLQEIESGKKQISDFTFKPEPAVWKAFSTDSDSCFGTSCKYQEDCAYMEAKRYSQISHVVLTNYHLLALHLKLMLSTDGNVGILPPANVIICDEAHELAQIFRQVLGFDVSYHRTMNQVKYTDEKGQTNFGPLVLKTFQGLREYFHSGAYSVRFKEKLPEELGLQALYDALALVYDKASQESFKRPDDIKLKARLRHITALQSDISKLIDFDGSEDTCFIEPNNQVSNLATFKFLKTDISGILSKDFWPLFGSQVITSATLKAGGSFDFAKEEMGLLNPNTLTVSSPFDYENNMRIDVLDIPDPKSKQYMNGLIYGVEQTIQRMDGRTLFLFTSYQEMEAVIAAIRPNVKHTILVQERTGGLTQEELIRRFKNDKHSVLFGTDSYWTGVDVPGEALSCVFIAKIPFPRPDDPVIDSLIAQYSNYWTGWAKQCLPRAAVKMAQGVGRLIRTETDTGRVIIADSRMTTQRYGKTLMDSFPSCPRGVIEVSVSDD